MSYANDDIMVSIICNTYNHEKYIEHAIQSFLMQEVPFKYEILIHDDASTDNTQVIIKRYTNSYPDIIKPILQTENQHSKGIKINLAYQYPRAKGKYLAYCEGDDFWTDEKKLARQIDFLEKHKDYVACVHKYNVVNEDETPQNIKTFGYYKVPGDFNLDDLLADELPSQVATLVFRNIVTKQGTAYPLALNDVRIQGDIKLFLYLLTHGKIYRMNEEMSSYRFVQKIGGDSWSSRRLGKPHNYEDLKRTLQLEKVYYEIYNKKISFLGRKQRYRYGVLQDLKLFPSLQTLKNALTVLVSQPTVIIFAIKTKIRQVREVGKKA